MFWCGFANYYLMTSVHFNFKGMNEENLVSWYPSPPHEEVPVIVIPCEIDVKHDVKEIFTAAKLKYTSSNLWHSISKEQKEGCRRFQVKGVEVRKLGKDHPLCGEYGLFASRKYSRFDIVGEYTGKIVGNKVGGHYVAALEDKEYDESLGIDALTMGNEMRFINSYLGVSFQANVIMKTVYVDTYPRIVIVCKEDISVGDEFLLDYGEAYHNAYITKKVSVRDCPVSVDDLKAALPMMTESSEEDED